MFITTFLGGKVKKVTCDSQFCDVILRCLLEMKRGK